MGSLQRSTWTFAGVVLVFLVVAYLILSSPNVPDPDSFYHIRHASIYRTNGIAQKAFPWVQYSVIRTYAADIWYGFHIILIPFTFFSDLFFGLRVGSVVFSTLVVLLILVAFYRLELQSPFAWLAILFSCSTDMIFRTIMLRPHPFSLAFALLLFGALTLPPRGSARRRRVERMLIFALGMLSAWLHLALLWLPILVYLTVALWGLVFKSRRRAAQVSAGWRDGMALLSGVGVGCLSRPNPLGALQIAYVQVVGLLGAKGLPLKIGNELRPMAPRFFFVELWPLLVVFGFAIVLFLRRELSKGPHARGATQSSSIMLWSSLSLSLGFLALTFVVARRSLELFLAFAVIFVAKALQEHVRQASGRRTLLGLGERAFLGSLVVSFAIFGGLHTFPMFQTYMSRGYSPKLLRESALWLKAHAEPNAIVFNPNWDRFGQLFFWNPNNYYINGMDPIFEYAYDPSLYWKTHYYSSDEAAAATCGAIQCTEAQLSPTIDVLRHDFHAKYVVVEKDRTPNFYEYLSASPDYANVLDGVHDAVFELNSP